MKKFLMLIILMSLLLSGCGAESITPPPTETLAPPTNTAVPPTETLTPTATETPLPSATPTETLTPTPAVIGPDFFPAGLNPLTGKPPADPALLERRPISVKVNITPRRLYRPPYGLSLADIVFDYYHNAGSSRLHAIFYGNDADLIGGIRSGRMFDGELVRMYKSVFAFGSADIKIRQRLFNSEYSDRLVLEGSRSSCPPTAERPMCRMANTPGDLLLSGTAALESYMAAKGVDVSRQDLSGMSFGDLAPEGGQAADQVYVRYSGDSYVRWDYDSASGRYLHFQDGAYDNANGRDEKYDPLIDASNNQQIAADNVVVVLVRHEYYQTNADGGEIIDILLSGTGTAYAFRDGQVYEVTWNRPTFTSVLSLTYADGSPFPFKPGQTWFQLVGFNTEITQPSGEAWRFVHFMP
jgi:hypothetical protein